MDPHDDSGGERKALRADVRNSGAAGKEDCVERPGEGGELVPEPA